MDYSRFYGTSLLATVLLVVSMGLMTVGSAEPVQALEGKLTGNVGFVSQYVFRGFLENEDGAVQGGFDYSHPSGFYAGYWTSSLGSDQSPGAATGTSGTVYADGAMENDFYAGYTGTYEGIGYDIGALQYVYMNDDPGAGSTNDANEVYASLSKGPFSIGATLTTKTAAWTEEGDIFYTASYGTNLIGDLDVSGLVRSASLDDGPNTAWGGNVDDGLSQIEVGLSHPLGDSGANMNFRYIANDTDSAQGLSDNQLVLGVTYGFDIADGTLM